jgi:hypothetical protein
VAGLLLDEQRVPAGLDQVGDVGPAQRVELQRRVHTQRVALGREPSVDRRQPDPGTALRGPQRGRAVAGQHRPDLGDPLVQDLRHPPPDRQDAAPPGRRPGAGLAIPDLAHAVVPELRRARAGRQIGQVEHRGLAAAQPERIRRLDQDRVPERRDPALPPRPVDRRDPVVQVIEEHLQLGDGERAALRLRLAFLGMAGSVPPGTDLHRVRAEVAQAHLRPGIDRIRQVPAEQPDRAGVPAQRGGGHMMDRPQVSTPLLEQLRRPQPGRASRVVTERPDPSPPPGDRIPAQPASALLIGPARQHRLQHLLLGAQQRHARYQGRMSRPGTGHRGPARPAASRLPLACTTTPFSRPAAPRAPARRSDPSSHQKRDADI